MYCYVLCYDVLTVNLELNKGEEENMELAKSN